MTRTLTRGVKTLLTLSLAVILPATTLLPAAQAEIDTQPTSQYGDLGNYLKSIVYVEPLVALPADDLQDFEDMANYQPEKPGVSIFKMIFPTHGANDRQPGPSFMPSFPGGLSLNFLKPVPTAVITSLFGMRWGRPHKGIDFSAAIGTPIRSAENGTVIFSGPNGSYGNFVAVDHGHGYITRYAHASALLLRKGQRVGKGQIIAKIGNTGRSTGPHLHFEVLAHGVAVNPQQFLNRSTSIALADSDN